jgi:hypothetical protein
MACKLAKPGFVTIAQLARKLGVSGQAVSQAIRSGRLVAYNNQGEAVPPGYAGRKWLSPASAGEDWHNRRQRCDVSAAPDDLVAARTKTAALQAMLLQMRILREQGDVIPRAASLAAKESLGRAVQRAGKAIPGWAEEITAAALNGGVGAVSALLRAKSVELSNAVADLITATEAELIEDLPDRGQ